MEITCQGCGKQYHIADEKLPKKGIVSVRCPQCQEKITINISLTDTPREGDSSTLKGLEFFKPDTKTALLYCPEKKAAGELLKGLEELGYEVRLIENKDDLSSRLKYHIYDVIILYQKGREVEKELAEILLFLHSMPIDDRRKIFVVLILFSGNRADTMRAFFMSVDLTLSPMDIVNLPEVLPLVMETRQAKYKSFLELKERLEEQAL